MMGKSIQYTNTIARVCFALMLTIGGLSGTQQAAAKEAPSQTQAATQNAQPTPPELDNTAFVLMDFATGQVLAQKNADEFLPPASLTKMMTSFIVEQKLIKGELHNEDLITVSNEAACDLKKGESCMFLRAGSKAKVIDVLRGIVIQSGNDASRAIAEHIAGTETDFAMLMNEQAKRLGLENTNFRNATGMPQIGHESTALDLAKLARAIIRENSIYYPIYAEKSFTYDDIKQYNRNQLLFSDDTVDGLKTGHTEAAGYCLVASSKKGDSRLISVVLGTKSKAQRTKQTKELLNWGFSNFTTKQIAPKNMFVAKAPVWFGAQQEVNLIAADSLSVVVPKGQNNAITTKAAHDRELEAPLSKGQKVGVLSAYVGDKPIAQTDIVVAKAVAEAGFFKRTWHHIKRFFVNLF